MIKSAVDIREFNRIIAAHQADDDTPLTPFVYLVYEKGGCPRAMVELDLPVTIVGRHRGCDIHLNSTDISYLHCLIFCDGDQLHVRDLRSRCGIMVNEEPVSFSRLVNGDKLAIGPFTFVVETNLSSKG